MLKDILLPVMTEIQAGRNTVEISELAGASKALFLFGLHKYAGRPVLAVTATEEESEALGEDLRFFSSQRVFFAPNDIDNRKSAEDAVSLFPPWGVLPFESDSPDSSTVGHRMRALFELLSGSRGIYVAPIRSLIQRLPPRSLFIDSVNTIRLGQEIDPGSFVNSLVSIGYEPTSLVSRIGEFSRRGGIIDVYSPFREHPVRLEFFGDTIESLREFDPETQHSVSEIDHAVVLPVREIIVTREGRDRCSRRTGGDATASQAETCILSPGSEFLAPFYYEMESLFHYLPEDCIIALIEPDDIYRQVEENLRLISEGRSEEIEEGRVLPEIAELYQDGAEIKSALSRFPVLNLRLLGMNAEKHNMSTKSVASLGIRLSKSFASGHAASMPSEGTISGLSEKLRMWQTSACVVIVCGTEESCRRIRNMFMEFGLPLTVNPSASDGVTGPCPAAIMIGRLSSGFLWPLLNLMVITEDDIFGAKAHRSHSQKSKFSPFLYSFRELRPGDFVVHRDYGVGEYEGLSHISVDGFETDFLALRYEPDAKLYVPLYSLEKVQKYVGAEGIAPRLNRLGAPAWARTKEKVKKDLLVMARELASLYAAREAMERTPFSDPDNLYREFESAFPYEETSDQERAIEEVLADMRRPRPMDRLVCGDVGYGKTEVALRSAFKAAEDGFQVAVLVPTTLLADQHYRTFSERLSAFPVRVEMLSRFRSRAEQHSVVRGLKSGSVDIVIGTHRLLQRDIVFKNLGLLVVDEEHRFGVRHKERIKEFKKLVDVLTLTATPIPRTLHMSLAGLRDLSVIQTPPLDRQSIQVVLARFGKRVIREAVLHEIGRGGQVFFVHNRVQGIERMAEFIRGLVPRVAVDIAHGQMKEDAIERSMAKFIGGETAVLVTTAIIESGIDIPNANTIIINRADRFGLAELYQIKGRVGRGRQKAYAYLLTPAEELLTDIARKRLRAIQELSELGAGFRIAAQDLETRGAGNLLGKQQSGHIAAVGIDLYTEMMEEAVSELRGEPREKKPDTHINLRASAFIPEEYIADISLRLAAYKEIAAAESDAELSRIVGDLRDRYGPLPEPAANLIEIMGIKLMVKPFSVIRIDAGAGFVSMMFGEHARVSPDKVMALINGNRGRIRLIPEHTLRISLPDESLATLSAVLKKCLQQLV